MGIFVPADVQRIWFRRMDGEALIQSDFTTPFSVAEGVQAVAAAGASLLSPGAAASIGHPGIWSLNTGAVSAAGRIFVISRANSFSPISDISKLYSHVGHVGHRGTVAARRAEIAGHPVVPGGGHGVQPGLQPLLHLLLADQPHPRAHEPGAGGKLPGRSDGAGGEGVLLHRR